LEIDAQPGGGFLDPLTRTLTAKLDASLVIDPGVVVKLSEARIETILGSQLIAEGSEGLCLPVIFYRFIALPGCFFALKTYSATIAE
jgi:hypothetical protein